MHEPRPGGGPDPLATTEDGASLRRRSDPMGLWLVIVAVIACHAALVVEVLRVGGAADWPLAGLIVVANLAIGLSMGLALRFRRVALLAILASAALTEAFLWRPASMDHNQGWISLVAVLGATAFLGSWFAMRWVDARFGPRG